MEPSIDTLFDFDKIRRGELLLPLPGARAPGTFDERAFAWTPAGDGAAIVGRITTEQEAFPCAYVDVWALDTAGACNYAYSSVSRRLAQCTMWWLLDDGSWRTARYVEDSLQSSGPEEGGPPGVPTERSLVCNDRARMFGEAAGAGL